MAIMIVFVKVIQGRIMSFLPAGFRNSPASSVMVMAALFLCACQPVLQTRTSVPVTFPGQTPAETAAGTDSEAAVNSPSSTALTTQEISAEPPEELAALLPQTSPDQNNQPSEADTAEENKLVIVVSRSAAPATPAVTPSFNPAELVGKPQSFVKTHFGQADFSRTEGVIHVLQYRQPDCVIDLFISVADVGQTTPSAEAVIMDWAMRERTVSQPLDLTLCQQQFFERKL